MHTYHIKHNGYTIGSTRGKREAIRMICAALPPTPQGLWGKMAGLPRFTCEHDGRTEIYSIERSVN